MLSVRCLSCLYCLSVCNVRALWPNGRTDQDKTWHAGRSRPWPHCVRWGHSSHSPKGAQTPQFSAHICCGQMAAWIKMSLGMELRPLPRRLCVRWGPRFPLPKSGVYPQFSAHVYCGQTAAWMKLVLGMVVGLSPGDSVLDGDPAPSPKRGRSPSPQFSAHFYSDQTAGCIKMPLGTDVGLSPGDFVLDGDPVPPPKKGAEPLLPPNFLRISIVAKRLDASRCHLVWR